MTTTQEAGSKGGKASSAKLTKEQRHLRAKSAVEAREKYRKWRTLLCRCSHSGESHVWDVQRIRGWCRQRTKCGCTKFRPLTDRKPPVSKVLGKARNRQSV